jgi:hypothetical protein
MATTTWQGHHGVGALRADGKEADGGGEDGAKGGGGSGCGDRGGEQCLCSYCRGIPIRAVWRRMGAHIWWGPATYH